MGIRDQLRDACKVVGGEWSDRPARCVLPWGDVEVRFEWLGGQFLEVIQKDEEDHRRTRIILSVDDVKKISGIKGEVIDLDEVVEEVNKL